MPRRYTFAMEIRHFRYFLAIAEAGSFAEGAKRLCIAQPSLTRQIRALEDQLGCPLFVRSWHGVQLTDSGEILLREARLAVAQFDLALKRTREGKQHPRKLALGMIPGTEDELMGRISAALGPELQDIAIDVHSKLHLDLIRALENGRIDAAFVRQGDIGPEWTSRTVQAEDLIAILPRGHALLNKRRLSPADLSKERIIAVAAAAAPALRATIDAFLHQDGTAPAKPPLEADGMLSIFSLVAATGLCSLVPSHFARMLPKGMATRRLTAFDSSRLNLVLAYAGNRASPIVSRLAAQMGATVN
ncbi:LysR family transcriptional regulator, hca operon transcriptional activator [Burkholderia vietnamiensis]|nr:LysR family hca operon transcriptional activator [Burkholderia vietnamiensis]SCZ21987.1 LysR family transcriptional regulator, hca operon transcriptional activator [Burkholderia vietnamiensis]SFX21555.1 LysR family transcriptional regulator, hca operon transcriptional activator [Burkholderia vietnamiensis]